MQTRGDWTFEEDKHLWQMKNDGESSPEIAEILSKSESSVDTR